MIAGFQIIEFVCEIAVCINQVFQLNSAAFAVIYRDAGGFGIRFDFARECHVFRIAVQNALIISLHSFAVGNQFGGLVVAVQLAAHNSRNRVVCFVACFQFNSDFLALCRRNLHRGAERAIRIECRRKGVGIFFAFVVAAQFLVMNEDFGAGTVCGYFSGEFQLFVF